MSAQETFREEVLQRINDGKPEEAFDLLKILLNGRNGGVYYRSAMDNLMAREDIDRSAFLNLLASDTNILAHLAEDQLDTDFLLAAKVLCAEGSPLAEAVMYQYVMAGARYDGVGYPSDPTLVEEFEIYASNMLHAVAAEGQAPAETLAL